MESVKIPASKMAAINRVQYHPPPPHSFCEGPRILKKLRDVVVQIVELPLYILSFLPPTTSLFPLTIAYLLTLYYLYRLLNVF